MTNDIISSYGLKQEDILTCTSSTKAGILHITIKLTNRGTRCHNCGTFTKLVKDYIQKDITNSIFIYKPCIIQYFQRFGKNAIIVSPIKIRNDMEVYYTMSSKAYRKQVAQDKTTDAKPVVSDDSL